MVKATVGEVLSRATAELESRGIEDAQFDSRQMLAAAMGVAASRLYAVKGEAVDALSLEKFNSYLSERLNRRPLQYILGMWEFYSLPFYVGEGVLIPRPDTEVLVDTALEFIGEKGCKTAIDLCSGSGCVSIALAKNSPTVEFTAVELFDIPFGYTERNIELNKCENITLVRGNVLDGAGGLSADLIVSNPPYIPSDDIPALSEEVGCEPVAALDGGADGLDFYRAIASGWFPAINHGGALMVEVGAGQADSVSEIFRRAGLEQVKTVRDLNGIERVVTGLKK